MRGVFSFFRTLFLLASLGAYASDIREHSAMTSEAIAQFEACFPKNLSPYVREILLYSNISEDLNLVEKWGFYSHFYNPHKDVSTWRGTSFNRVQDAEAFLTGWKKSLRENYSVLMVSGALSELGQVIHHIQDSAVPTHVIPVKHWLSDGFEGYRAPAFSTSFSCGEFFENNSPTQQIRQSALETLASLKQNFAGTKDNKPINLNWDYFWYDTGAKFGSYGYFGNAFGQTRIQTPGGIYEVPAQVYRKYWLDRREQSIRHTAKAMYWFFSNLLTTHHRNNVVMQDGSSMDLEAILFEEKP